MSAVLAVFIDYYLSLVFLAKENKALCGSLLSRQQNSCFVRLVKRSLKYIDVPLPGFVCMLAWLHQ